jgi:DNA topoisomerase IA
MNKVKVVLAEKPSVAKSIAAVLNANKRKGGLASGSELHSRNKRPLLFNLDHRQSAIAYAGNAPLPRYPIKIYYITNV